MSVKSERKKARKAEMEAWALEVKRMDALGMEHLEAMSDGEGALELIRRWRWGRMTPSERQAAGHLAAIEAFVAIHGGRP